MVLTSCIFSMPSLKYNFMKFLSLKCANNPYFILNVLMRVLSGHKGSNIFFYLTLKSHYIKFDAKFILSILLILVDIFVCVHGQNYIFLRGRREMQDVWEKEKVQRNPGFHVVRKSYDNY